MRDERFILKSDHHQAEAILLDPEKNDQPGVILAHGAGGNMNEPFISFFHRRIAEAGYPCLKFNFPYSQNKKKLPDPQPVLVAFYRKAIESMQVPGVVIGGKSMGGRIASYVADSKQVNGLLFLGYPLHAPGKVDQLRDEHLYKIRKPMLFLSGTRDPFARLDLLNRTVNQIGEFATLHCVEGGGHSLEVSRKTGVSNQEILHRSVDVILDWLRRLTQARR